MQTSVGIKYAVPNGTKLRGIVVKRAACLPAKSAKFPIKRHLAQPLRRSNMLNLVPLYAVPGILTVSRFVATDNQRTVFMDIKNNLKSKDELIPEQLIGFSIKMRDAALLSAERRQAYEWKFCILIWTAIGSISIALLIKKVEIHPNCWQFHILVFLSLAVISIEVYFQEKCRLANQVDKRRAELYEAVINASMGIAGPDYSILNAGSTKVSDEPQNCIQAINQSESKRKEVEKAIKKLKPGEGKWSRNSQILITIVLIVAFWILYLSIQGPKPS